MAFTTSNGEFISNADYVIAIRSSDPARIARAFRSLFNDHLYIYNRMLAAYGIDRKNELYQNAVKDIYQEAITVLVTNIQNGKFVAGAIPIGAYLYKICRNQVNNFKREQARVIKLDITEMRETSAMVNDEIQESDEAEIQSNRRKLLKKAISELREGCTDCLSKLLYEQLTANEIATIRNIELTSLKNEISRCKKELKQHLNKYYNLNQDDLWL